MQQEKEWIQASGVGKKKANSRQPTAAAARQ
jgi:hypothetical protein